MKRAILFLNLGGPETLADVRPFLYQLFVDPEIIRIPFTPLRKLVAWLISTGRNKKSQDLYRTIGGGSPIRRYTDAQAAGVEKALQEKGHEAYVRTAFTCSPPFVEDVVKEMLGLGVLHFFSFPLYPQYSYTTTRSGLGRVKGALQKMAPHVRLSELRSWPTHPLFLKAHAELIEEKMKMFSDPRASEIHLLFSAHSIPEKLVTQEGDPYKKEVEQTVQGVVETLKWQGPFSLAWQSRLGPVKWLEPSTVQVLVELGRKGQKQVLVVPIAFVSDHIETLCEIDFEFAKVASDAGIQEFKRTPGLNTHPTFLQCLTDLALAQKDFWG